MKRFLCPFLLIIFVLIAFTAHAQEEPGDFDLGVKVSYMQFKEKDNELRIKDGNDLILKDDELKIDDDNTAMFGLTQYFRFNDFFSIGLEESYALMNDNKDYSFYDLEMGFEVDKFAQAELNVKMDLFKNEYFHFVVGAGVSATYVDIEYDYKSNDTEWLYGYQGFARLGYEGPEGIYAQMGFKYQIVDTYENTDDLITTLGQELTLETDLDYSNYQYEFEIGMRMNLF